MELSELIENYESELKKLKFQVRKVEEIISELIIRRKRFERISPRKTKVISRNIIPELKKAEPTKKVIEQKDNKKVPNVKNNNKSDNGKSRVIVKK